MVNGSSKACKPEDIGVQSIPQSDLKPYFVFLAINPLCIGKEVLRQPREQVGHVLAKDLNDAFKMAQKEFNQQYAAYGKRSVTVGDLIMDIDNGFYLVKENEEFELVCTLEDDEHKQKDIM